MNEQRNVIWRGNDGLMGGLDGTFQCQPTLYDRARGNIFCNVHIRWKGAGTTGNREFKNGVKKTVAEFGERFVSDGKNSPSVRHAPDVDVSEKLSAVSGMQFGFSRSSQLGNVVATLSDGRGNQLARISIDVRRGHPGQENLVSLRAALLEDVRGFARSLAGGK